jgi:SAM-dependent methyltransferase
MSAAEASGAVSGAGRGAGTNERVAGPRLDAALNRASWDAFSDEYQARHGEQLRATRLGWGTFSIPESELGALGDVAGMDVLELGCGAAQWSIGLAGAGARPVGFDNSFRQLEHATANLADAGVRMPLAQADATAMPFRDESFDLVFGDHGAMSFADPYRTVPEAARVLRPGGLFVFNVRTPLYFVCIDPATDELTERLCGDYFGMHRFETPEEGGTSSVDYQLPYGEWIRLFRRNRLAVQDLIELRPPEGARSTYDSPREWEWERRWPGEHIWKLRKEAA